MKTTNITTIFCAVLLLFFLGIKNQAKADSAHDFKADAFNLMRRLGVGATNADFSALGGK